ncbi:MAG: hypothetical protein RBS39_03435 [Phycisphaerales bacterium]|jgi:flagellar basal body-associated protein FliL|nr:hypothetical protein [Phycisphaerales bacterium]
MAEEQATQETKAKKKLPIVTIGIVAGLMAVEGVVVFLLVGMTQGGKEAEASIEGDALADLEAPVEVPLLEEKFQNNQTGRVWLWDTVLVLKTRKKHEELVKSTLEARKAEVREGVAMIVAKATHTQLMEPGKETLKRQLQSLATNIFGTDPDGRPRVDDVLAIVKGSQVDR